VGSGDVIQYECAVQDNGPNVGSLPQQFSFLCAFHPGHGVDAVVFALQAGLGKNFSITFYTEKINGDNTNMYKLPSQSD